VTGGDFCLLALAVPLCGAFLIALAGRWPNVRETVTLATGLSLLVVVVALASRVFEGLPARVTLVQLMPGLALALDVEPLGAVFALLASGLWIVTSLYSIGYMRAHHEENQTRFYACFALAIAAAMGVALAGNLLTLFVFYEALTLSTYPLVTHHGTDEARRGGRTYLGLLLTTSVLFLLLAVVWTWQVAGTLDFRRGGILAGRVAGTEAGLLLALFAFGTGKAALMPFHRWLPAAMVAPTPVSALLHAVAVVKAGAFTVLKVVVYVFGIDLVQATRAGQPLAYVAAATIVLASVVALTKDNLKARLAYSTVAQLSYIVLGAMLANRWGVVGGAMHLVMHAFGKITLFFCAGAILVASHRKNVSEMGGIGRSMPFTMAAFLVGALAVLGLPPMGGAWSKWALVTAAVDAGDMVLVGALVASSLLGIGYLIPPVVRAFFAAPADPRAHGLPPEASPAHPAHEGTAKGGEAPVLCVLPLCATAAGCVALFFFADALYEMLRPLGGPP